GRYPHGDDVVVDFVVGADFYQLHRSFAPIAFGFDPQAGSALIVDAIEVVVKDAIPLEQAEAAWVVVGKGGGNGVRGIVQRAPEVFAAAGPDGEAIGVVDFGSPVDGAGLGVFGEPVHGGERREAEALDVFPQMEGHVDVHDDGLAPLHDEAVGATDAGAVEQGVDGDLVAAAGRGFEVDFANAKSTSKPRPAAA